MKHQISRAALPVAALLIAGVVGAAPAHASIPTYAELRALIVASVDDPFNETVLLHYVDASEVIGQSLRGDRISDSLLDRLIDRVEAWTVPGVPADAGITPEEAAELISLAEALKAA